MNENSGLEPGFTPDRALTQAGANLSRRMEWIVLKMHKFTLGQTVRYIAGPLNRATADGTFKIMKLLPPEEWIDFSHRVIWHGRRLCTARKPKCGECPLAEVCPSAGKIA